MMQNKGILTLLKEKKPIIAMIHLKGDTKEEVLERGKREIDLLIQGGIDGLIWKTTMEIITIWSGF